MHGLSGKQAICQFMGMGWPKVEKLIIEYGFPAKKIGGTWESDAELINAWRKALISKKPRGNPNFAKKANNIRN